MESEKIDQIALFEELEPFRKNKGCRLCLLGK